MRLLLRRVFALIAATAAARMASAQTRVPIAQTLDVRALRDPEILTIGGRPVLVYELQLTNLLRTPVAVSRLAVLDGRAPRRTIADVWGDELRQLLGRPGVREAPDARRIAPAARAVAYLWIELPSGTRVPRALRHLVEMEVVESAGPDRVAFGGAPSIVATKEPAVLGPPLRGGAWVAAYHPRLVGGHRTVYYTIDGKARFPGRFAIDWVQLRPDGRYAADTVAGRDRNGFGAEVLAVADGVVAHAMDGSTSTSTCSTGA
jgi:hypothetical protein